MVHLQIDAIKRRTLTGAWIETFAFTQTEEYQKVAPSRVRGLKPFRWIAELTKYESHPHECVD